MAVLVTCNAATSGAPGDPVDLFGVGDVHGHDLMAYVELDEEEIDQCVAAGLSLEAEGIQDGVGSTTLLLVEVGAESVQFLEGKLLWKLRRFPSGMWRLSLRIAGQEGAHRVIGVGAY